jgi:hypothetical protein
VPQEGTEVKYIADGGPIRVEKREIPSIWSTKPLAAGPARTEPGAAPKSPAKP